MMKRIWAIIKKELKKFFTNPRMLGAIFLPGILIFCLYTLMGNIMNKIDFTGTSNDYEYRVVMTNNYRDNIISNPKSKFEIYLTAYLELESYPPAQFEYISTNEIEKYKTQLLDRNIDLLVQFSDDFENYIENPISTITPNANIWYNKEIGESEKLYSVAVSIIQTAYQSFTINITNPNPGLGNSSYTMNQIVSFVLPMITISLLYSATLSSCTESIAGEKERGTLASILISPIKRSELALGKIAALSIVSIVAGTVSGAGVVASLPSMIGDISISISSYFLLFLMILTAVVFFVALASVVSAFAKTVKEALSYLGPFTGIFVVLALIPAISPTTGIWYSFIPVLNICSAISMILKGTVDFLFLSMTILSNIVYTILFVFLIVKMFNNESIMFRR